MANNCLVTKLKASVDNNNLDLFGYVHLYAVAQEPTDYDSLGGTQFFRVDASANGSVKIKVIGDGGINTSQALVQTNPLTEYTIPANSSKNFYCSNGNYSVHVEKKNLYRLIMDNDSYSKQCVVSLKDLKQLRGCNSLGSFSCHRNFDIKEGSVREIMALPNVFNIDVQNSYVNGEIKASDSPIIMFNSRCYGDFTTILNTSTSANNNPFATLEGDTKGGPCTADLSQASSVYKILSKASGTLTWKTQRDTSYYIIALPDNPDFGTDLDAMLINQAQCVKGATTQTGLDTYIKVRGTRTSASDAAVATLKGLGYRIIVNGVTL